MLIIALSLARRVTFFIPVWWRCVFHRRQSVACFEGVQREESPLSVDSQANSG